MLLAEYSTQNRAIVTNVQRYNRTDVRKENVMSVIPREGATAPFRRKGIKIVELTDTAHFLGHFLPEILARVDVHLVPRRLVPNGPPRPYGVDEFEVVHGAVRPERSVRNAVPSSWQENSELTARRTSERLRQRSDAVRPGRAAPLRASSLAVVGGRRPRDASSGTARRRHPVRSARHRVADHRRRRHGTSASSGDKWCLWLPGVFREISPWIHRNPPSERTTSLQRKDSEATPRYRIKKYYAGQFRRISEFEEQTRVAEIEKCAWEINSGVIKMCGTCQGKKVG